MRYQPKDIEYPLHTEELRIITPSGVVHCAFNDRDLAVERLKKCPLSWRLIQVSIKQEDITPRRRAPKSQTVADVAKRHGLHLVDAAPLAMSS